MSNVVSLSLERHGLNIPVRFESVPAPLNPVLEGFKLGHLTVVVLFQLVEHSQKCRVLLAKLIDDHKLLSLETEFRNLSKFRQFAL